MKDARPAEVKASALDRHRNRKPSHIPEQADWQVYEALKARLTAGATTPEGYDKAIRLAVQIAGV